MWETKSASSIVFAFRLIKNSSGGTLSIFTLPVFLVLLILQLNKLKSGFWSWDTSAPRDSYWAINFSYCSLADSSSDTSSSTISISSLVSSSASFSALVKFL